MARNRNGNLKTSAKQQQANRLNALRSTGPRTAAGKKRASQNAMTHGLLAHEILLPDEDREAFEDLARRMRAEAQPVGVQEDALVEHMIACWWRLRRLARVETGIFMSAHWELLRNRAHREALRLTHLDGDESTMDELSLKIERMPAHSRSVKRQQALARQARATEQEMVRQAEGATPMLGKDFIREVSALLALSRYATGIERSLYRAVHELERLQRARQGEHVPAPVAVDVTMTGDDATSNGLPDPGAPRNEA